MKLKLLGSSIANASGNNIGTATLVRVHATSAATLTLKLASAGDTVGTVYVGAGETVFIEKNPTEEITCATSHSTAVAFSS